MFDSGCGSKSSGLTVVAASWQGAVRVELAYSAATGRNEYTVRLMPGRT